jgi:hypothetical protein
VSDNESNHAPITRKDQGCLNWKKDRPGAWFQGKITVYEQKGKLVADLDESGFARYIPFTSRLFKTVITLFGHSPLAFQRVH